MSSHDRPTTVIKPGASIACAIAITWATSWAITSADASAGDWSKFTLQTPYLAVDMPGTPTKKVEQNHSFIGDVSTDEYSAKDGIDTYSVEVTELPGFAVAFAGADSIYEHAKGMLLAKTLSKAISFTDVTLDGVQGKRLVYDTPTKPDHPEMQGEARVFLLDDWLYVADAVVEMKGGDEKQARFFSSFSIKE